MKCNKLILLLFIASASGLIGCSGQAMTTLSSKITEPVTTDITPPLIDLIGNSTINVGFNAAFGELSAMNTFGLSRREAATSTWRKKFEISLANII